MATLLALVLAATGACDRTPSFQRTRAGEAIAVETHHTAASVAERMAGRADPACGSYPLTGPVRAEVHWVIEGARQAAIVLELDETRTVEVDEAGRIRVRRHVEFMAARGRTGERDREWRLIDGQVYSRDVNLPFERRQADGDDARHLRDQVAEVFETLVRAVGTGWTTVQAGADGVELRGAADQDGQPVRCGREGEPDPWLAPLLAEARVVDAQAHVQRDPRSGRVVGRTGSFSVVPRQDEGRDLRVVVEERVTWGPLEEPIEVPEQVADTTPRRLVAEVNGFLRDLAAEGTGSEGTGQ